MVQITNRETEVMQIRWCLTDGSMSPSDVAQAFGVPVDYVAQIAKGLPVAVPAAAIEDAQVVRRAESILRLMESPPRLLGVSGQYAKPWPWFDGPIVMDLSPGSLIFPDTTLDVIGPSVDACVGFAGAGDPREWYRFQAQRLKSVKPSAVRGLVHQRFAAMRLFEYGAAIIPKNEARGFGSSLHRGLVIHRRILAFSNGRWFDATLSPTMRPAGGGDTEKAKADPGSGWRPDVDTDDEKRLGCMLGAQLTSHYEWTVKLRLAAGHMSASMWVKPGALRDLFALRDVPEGGKRRAALLNWVAGHWRRKGDGDDASWVRKHIRGAETFTIGSMTAQIRPSRDALLEIERLKSERNKG